MTVCNVYACFCLLNVFTARLIKRLEADTAPGTYTLCAPTPFIYLILDTMDLNEPQVLNDKGLYQDGSQADGMGNDMANGREHVGDESVAQEDAQVNDRYENDSAWATEDDWIWKITADSEEGDRKVQGGVPLFMIDGEWRHVSHKHWAWTPLVVRRKTYRQREDTSRYIVTVFWEYDSFKWIPKVPLPFTFD